MVAQECTGRRGVVGHHSLVCAADGDVDPAYSSLIIDGRVSVHGLTETSVQMGTKEGIHSTVVPVRFQLMSVRSSGAAGSGAIAREPVSAWRSAQRLRSVL